VFFSTKVFGEKSYPSVDGAFPFPATRFGDQQPVIDELDLGHGAESETETSDEDDELEIPRRHGGRWHPMRLRDHVERALEDAHIALFDPAVRIGPLPIGRLAARVLRRQVDVVHLDELVRDAIEVHHEALAEESDSEEEELERIQVTLEGVPIQMTPEEEAAVRRLHAMVPGFHVNTVVQVYFACDKDETATHQCLLSMV
jgi:hypothetical protein